MHKSEEILNYPGCYNLIQPRNVQDLRKSFGKAAREPLLIPLQLVDLQFRYQRNLNLLYLNTVENESLPCVSIFFLKRILKSELFL